MRNLTKYKLDKETHDTIKEIYKKYRPTNIDIIAEETKSIATPIKEIIDNASSGKWIFPVFQRPYVWNPSQVEGLLESILLNYFIGSFLVWKTDSKKDLPFETTDIDNNRSFSKNISGIILDGRQRITSLYRVVKIDSETPLYYYINFQSLANRILRKKIHSNVKKQSSIVFSSEKELDENDMYKKFYFPLYKIYQYKDVLNKLKDYYKDYEEYKYINYFVDNFIKEKLKHFWEDPIVPVINLHKDICPDLVPMIFEIINTKGLKLNTFDILVAHLAYLSNFDINLRKMWNKAIDHKSRKIYPELKKVYDNILGVDLPLSIIQGMHLYYSIEENVPSVPSEENILKLYDKRYKIEPNTFKNDWQNFVKITEKALEVMEDRYGVFKKAFLPATSLLPTLIAILAEVNSLHKSFVDFQNKIDTWYWSAVFSGEYKASTTTHMAEDVQGMKKWFSDDKKIPEVINNAISRWDSEKNIDNLKTTRGAIYKGVISLIRSNKPLDLFLTTKKTKSIIGDNADTDHIFPENMFEEKNYKKYKEYKESILNKTLSSVPSNRGQKNKLKPSELLKKLEKNHTQREIKELLKDHFINDEAFNAMENDDFEAFLNARGKVILKEIRKRIMPPHSLTQPRNTTQHDITRPNKHNTI